MVIGRSFKIIVIVLFLGACSSESFKEEDKVFYSVGDSITWQDGKEYAHSGEIASGFQTLIKEETDFTYVANKGISGASTAKSDNYPTNGSVLLDNDFSDAKYADFVSVFVGTNDFKLNVPVGSLSNDNFDTSTFIGAYQELIESIQNENSEVEIIIVTPLQRNNDGYDVDTVNQSGYSLIDYIDATKMVADFYEIQVVDLYTDGKINVKNLDKYTIDGLHPNEEGYKVIASEIIEEVESLN